MKSRMILIFALFLTLTSFRSDERVVKQSDVNIFRSANVNFTKPEFIKRLRDLTAYEGESAQFVAQFVGVPECEVTWYKNDVEIKSDERIKITTEKGGITRLTFNVTYLEDEGEYSVRIKNVVGTDVSKAKLTVKQNGI